MDIKKIIKRKQTNKKSITLSIRITPEISRWMKEKNYSPTGIFMEAVSDLKKIEQK